MSELTDEQINLCWHETITPKDNVNPNAKRFARAIAEITRKECGQICHDLMMEYRHGNSDDDGYAQGREDGAEACRRAICPPKPNPDATIPA